MASPRFWGFDDDFLFGPPRWYRPEMFRPPAAWDLPPGFARQHAGGSHASRPQAAGPAGPHQSPAVSLNFGQPREFIKNARKCCGHTEDCPCSCCGQIEEEEAETRSSSAGHHCCLANMADHCPCKMSARHRTRRTDGCHSVRKARGTQRMPDTADNVATPAVTYIGDAENGDFLVTVDTSGFKAEDIVVKTLDNKLYIEAKSEFQSSHGYDYRLLRREFDIPRAVNPTELQSRLGRDGMLTISAPRLHTSPPSTCRLLPLQIEGEEGEEESDADYAEVGASIGNLSLSNTDDTSSVTAADN